MEPFKDPELRYKLSSDSDFENIFEEIIEKKDIKNPSDLRNFVKEAFHDNKQMNEKLEKWFNKLKLDRTKLGELFRK